MRNGSSGGRPSRRANAFAAAVASVLLLRTSTTLGRPEPVDVGQIKKSVGLVLCGVGSQVVSFGSGFVIGPRHVATNAHVVFQRSGVPCERVHVVFPKDRRNPVLMRILEADGPKDLAVLETAETADLPRALALAPPDEVKDSSTLVVIGYPGAADVNRRPDFVPKSFKGIVSAVQYQQNPSRRVVLTDAEINPGNSGGPAIDLCGRVVGIATFKSRQANVGWLLHVEEVHSRLRSWSIRYALDPGSCETTRTIGGEISLPGLLGEINPVFLAAALAGALALLVLLLIWRAISSQSGFRPQAVGPPPRGTQPPPYRQEAPAQPPPQRPSWKVAFERGALEGMEVELESGQSLVLGRDPAVCNVVFPETSASVSRKHATIRVRDGTFEVLDHHSSSGTRINGTACTPGEWLVCSGMTNIELGGDARLRAIPA